MNNTSPDDNAEKYQNFIATESRLLDGLQPAFQNLRTGELHLSQTKDGNPADIYEFTGLPEMWIAERDSSGNAIALIPEVIAGYWINGKFIALSQINNMPFDS